MCFRDGSTERLQDRWASGGNAEARISDTQLRRTHTEKVDFAQMEPEARQAFLRNLNEPPHLKLSVPKKRLPPEKISQAEEEKDPEGRKATPRKAKKKARKSRRR